MQYREERIVNANVLVMRFWVRGKPRVTDTECYCDFVKF
jgi:hypothetical protein